MGHKGPVWRHKEAAARQKGASIERTPCVPATTATCPPPATPASRIGQSNKEENSHIQQRIVTEGIEQSQTEENSHRNVRRREEYSVRGVVREEGAEDVVRVFDACLDVHVREVRRVPHDLCVEGLSIDQPQKEHASHRNNMTVAEGT